MTVSNVPHALHGSKHHVLRPFSGIIARKLLAHAIFDPEGRKIVDAIAPDEFGNSKSEFPLSRAIAKVVWRYWLDHDQPPGDKIRQLIDTPELRAACDEWNAAHPDNYEAGVTDAFDAAKRYWTQGVPDHSLQFPGLDRHGPRWAVEAPAKYQARMSRPVSQCWEPGDDDDGDHDNTLPIEHLLRDVATIRNDQADAVVYEADKLADDVREELMANPHLAADIDRLSAQKAKEEARYQKPSKRKKPAKVAISDADLDGIRRTMGEVTWRQDMQSESWIGKAVAKAMGWNIETSDGKAKTRAAVDALFARGVLEVYEGRDSKRNTRKFVRISDKPEQSDNLD